MNCTNEGDTKKKKSKDAEKKIDRETRMSNTVVRESNDRSVASRRGAFIAFSYFTLYIYIRNLIRAR